MNLASGSSNRSPFLRLLIVVAVVAVLGGLFLFGLMRGSPDRDIESTLLGRRVPAFELPVHASLRTEYGSTFTFDPERLQGPVIVNFWASWCAPCRDEAPVLESAWRRHGDRVTVVGVQTQDPNLRAGQAFINEFGLSFPNVIDNPTRTSIDWGLFGVPETYFIREDGTLAHKEVGLVTPELMDHWIGEMLQ